MAGSPSWGAPVPVAYLAGRPITRIELRPTQIDRTLAVAGHSDVRVEPLRDQNSWFYDGSTWRNDMLAGPEAGITRGTYRIFLLVDQAS